MDFRYKTPRIAERYTVMPGIDGDTVLYSNAGVVNLHADSVQLLPLLLKLLDGRHDVPDIIRQLGQFEADRVITTLEQLQSAGILEETPAEDATWRDEEKARYRDQITFFSNFALSAVGDIEGMSPYVPAFAHEYQLRLKQARVGIFGLGRLGAQLGRMLALVGVGHILGVDHESVQLQDTFADSGYSAVHIGRPRAEAEGEIITSTNPFVAYSASCETPETVPQYADLLRSCTFAILCRDYQQPGEYELFNLAALETDTPWISCRAIGFEFDYGPCVLPRKTPCYKCFDLRQKSNLPDYEAYVLEENLLNTHQIGLVSLAITPGLSLVALEVVKAITNFMQPATLAHVCSYNILTGELARHPILKIPRCPHCGRPSQNRPTIQAWQQSDIP